MPEEKVDLTDYEIELYSDLYAKLAQAKRDLTIAYTASLAARNLKGFTVTNTDLKEKKLEIKKND